MQQLPVVQDLSNFRLPEGLRGRSGLYVLLWWTVRDIFFRHSPQPFYGWRRWLLRLFGARIGAKVKIRETVRVTFPWKLRIDDYAWVGDFVELYTLGPIHIGEHAVVSQKSYLCTGTHDHRSPSFDISTQSIVIAPQAWVAADVFVGPGVTVGLGAVVAARSTLLNDVAPYAIVAGAPARVVGKRIADEKVPSPDRHQLRPTPL